MVIFKNPPNRHHSLQIATDFAPNRHVFLINLSQKKDSMSGNPWAEGTSLQSSEIAAAGSVLRRLHRRSLADSLGERLAIEKTLGPWDFTSCIFASFHVLCNCPGLDLRYTCTHQFLTPAARRSHAGCVGNSHFTMIRVHGIYLMCSKRTCMQLVVNCIVVQVRQHWVKVGMLKPVSIGAHSVIQFPTLLGCSPKELTCLRSHLFQVLGPHLGQTFAKPWWPKTWVQHGAAKSTLLISTCFPNWDVGG